MIERFYGLSEFSLIYIGRYFFILASNELGCYHDRYKYKINNWSLLVCGEWASEFLKNYNIIIENSSTNGFQVKNTLFSNK